MSFTTTLTLSGDAVDVITNALLSNREGLRRGIAKLTANKRLSTPVREHRVRMLEAKLATVRTILLTMDEAQ